MLNKKWTLYLYYDGLLIKKLKIDENTDITKEIFEIRVIGHKELFRKNLVKILVKPVKLLKTDEAKRTTHLGVVLEKGVDI